MQKRRIVAVSSILMLLFLSIGCTQHYLEGFHPQSHFDYPNSNVIPIGRAVGEASVTKIFAPPFPSAELEEEAIKNALKQKGGDILVNYAKFYDMTSILGIINTLTIRVEGTAAKMEIGKQKLN
jgi:hypothetical protein